MPDKTLLRPVIGTPRITHVINNIGSGGAEKTLLRVLASADPAAASMNVVTLIPGDGLLDQFQAAGIPVTCLSRSGGTLSKLLLTGRLTRHLKETRPEVVVTWLYHSNLIGSLAARRAGNLPLVWNIHHSELDHRAKRSTRLVFSLGRRLSHKQPKRVVYVAETGKAAHLRQGYCEQVSTVIPNGFDLNEFRPSDAARFEVRRQLGIGPAAVLIALVARFHPDKDPENFIRAAAHIRAQRPGVRFALCGIGMTPQNGPLMSLLAQHGVGDVCHLLGVRRDVSQLLAAADLALMSSVTEAFPNVLGEAMACGTPCVSTDVGDVRLILGSTGRSVPVRDARALARATLEMLALPAAVREALGLRARERIREQFALGQIANRHLRLWLTAADRSPHHQNRRIKLQSSPEGSIAVGRLRKAC